MGSRHLVRIISSADEDYSISIRRNRVVVVIRDPHDPFQNWFKDEIYGKTKKDNEGQPAFSLINEATDEAITLDGLSRYLFGKHCGNSEEPTLWTSKNTDQGSSMCIRLMQDPSRVFSVLSDGYFGGGSVIGLSTAGKSGTYQNWKIVEQEIPVPLYRTPIMDPSEVPAVTISCGIMPGYNLTICNNAVMVAPSNFSDRRQHWIKKTIDTAQKRAFALVNKATGLAIEHREKSPLVRLVLFSPYYVDESILWTESDDVGNGFHYIRMINDTTRVLDLIHAHLRWVSPALHPIIKDHPWQHWKSEETT